VCFGTTGSLILQAINLKVFVVEELEGKEGGWANRGTLGG